ncbi:hypothetical protein ACA910_017403 [Epithemia clementina (nom. ined.)]
MAKNGAKKCGTAGGGDGANVANSLTTSNTVLGEESSGVYSHANSKKNGKRFEWKAGFDLDLTKLPGPQLMGKDLVKPIF